MGPRAGLERWLQSVWFSSRRPPWYLRALVPLYAWLRERDAAKQRLIAAQERLPVPVIVIGNFTVGGTGKTPLCIAVLEHLAERGWRPGVVSRGYGRASSAPQRVSAGSSAAEVGDEPLLIFKRTLAAVQVDAERRRAAGTLIGTPNRCDVLLADDALQHLRLPRDIEIEVSDARGYGNGFLLPAGPLREMPRNCDLRVLTVSDDAQAVPDGVCPMRLRIDEARRLRGGERRPLTAFQGQTVHALAGIGHPRRFFDALLAAGLQVIEHPLPDHHRLQPADIPKDGRPVFLTEKDAVKTDASPDWNGDIWVIPLEARLPSAFWKALDARLDAVRDGKPQSARLT